MGRFLPYGKQVISEEDIARVVEVLRSDWLTTGPMVDRFEKSFGERVGASHAVSFNSGTAALHAAYHAAGLGPGNELVTTPLTFCATANAAVYLGAAPRFADVKEDTLNLCPGEAEAKITSATKALAVVDYAGQPADLDEFKRIAKNNGLVLIEDACHALGAEYGGKPVGSVADMTIFSFHPVKHITTGEGGMVTTDNPEYAEKLRLFRNHGIDRDARTRQAADSWEYDMLAPGMNYRLCDISCALGASQLERLDENLASRKKISEVYLSNLSGMEQITLPSFGGGAKHALHLFPVRLTDASARRFVFDRLRAAGIGVNVHYKPVHLLTYYRNRFGHGPGDFPVAEDAYDRLISLPMWHGMRREDAERVSDELKNALSDFS